MKRFSLLSEQEVLRELNIPTFRHITKEKLMSFAAMRQQMDPATAQKAMEQVPNLTQSMTEILSDYSELAKQGLSSNDEHMRCHFAIAATTINVLQNELGKPGLTFEDRCAIMDRMLAVNDQVSHQVIENQRFIHRGQIIVGTLIFLCFGATAAILGANTNLQIAKPQT